SKPLHFTLVTGTDAARAAESAALAANWQALGVAVTIITYANDTLYANFAQQGILATGRWDIALYGLMGSADPDFTYDIFHSSAIPSQANPGGVNYAHISDPQIDAALQKERETLNFDDRVEALKLAQERIVAQQFDVAPLYIWPVITTSGAQLRGVLVGPALNQTDWNIADWWLAA
ncbi:MAG: hypothetical protein IVW57_19755, partial [Ktedonobacterales bacterium]|nr:hypothetical protein [Ktedonobacterales bacterium]